MVRASRKRRGDRSGVERFSRCKRPESNSNKQPLTLAAHTQNNCGIRTHTHKAIERTRMDERASRGGQLSPIQQIVQLSISVVAADEIASASSRLIRSGCSSLCRRDVLALTLQQLRVRSKNCQNALRIGQACLSSQSIASLTD